MLDVQKFWVAIFNGLVRDFPWLKERLLALKSCAVNRLDGDVIVLYDSDQHWIQYTPEFTRRFEEMIRDENRKTGMEKMLEIMYLAIRECVRAMAYCSKEEGRQGVTLTRELNGVIACQNAALNSEIVDYFTFEIMRQDKSLGNTPEIEGFLRQHKSRIKQVEELVMASGMECIDKDFRETLGHTLSAGVQTVIRLNGIQCLQDAYFNGKIEMLKGVYLERRKL